MRVDSQRINRYLQWEPGNLDIILRNKDPTTPYAAKTDHHIKRRPMNEDDDLNIADDASPTGENAHPLTTLRSDVAAKAILSALLEVLTARENGVLLAEDPEHLHDFRIAVRRTRSALEQFNEVFPPRLLAQFAAHFKWLGQITTPSRDFDVYLLGFVDLKAALPAASSADIDPLREFLERHATLAHRQLAKQLRSRRYALLLGSWRKFLDAPCPKRPSAPLALAPIKTLADRRIWKLFRKVLRQGLAIQPDSPPESIHRLRKTCKKLRYLLEFFRDHYPADEIKTSIKQLKKLQDYLGDFQDAHARIAMLTMIGLEMRQDPEVPTKALLACGMLLHVLHRQQQLLRDTFPRYFKPFAKSQNRTRFRLLFKPQSAPESG